MIETGLWLDEAIQEAMEEAERRLSDDFSTQKLKKYQQDPIGFAEDYFDDYLTDDMKEVMLSVRDNAVTIAKSGNSTGKTYGSAKIALWFYAVYSNSKVFLTAAPPLDNLKRLLWGEIQHAIRKRPALFESHKQRSLYIQRHPQSFIQCLTIPQTGTDSERESKFAGKHSSHMLFIVDEGDAVPDAVYRGIESCMSGGHTRLLVMFNPRQKAGVVYRKEKNQQANIVRMSALDHPNVITGKDVISGAVDRQTTVKRINEWTRPLKEKEDPEKMDSFTVPDFLIGVTAVADDGKEYPPLPAGERKIINPAFSYMVLGLYPAQSESQLIDGEMIEQAQQRWKLYVTKHGEEQDGQPKMGLDVAEMGNDYNIACFRYAGFVEKFYHYWNGIDSDATATRALGLYKQKNVEMAYIDGTSWGSSVAPSMSRQGRSDGVRAVSVKLAESPEDFLKVEMGEFYQLRDQLYWAIREWLHKDNTAMLPPDPELEEELRALEYTVDGRGRIKVTNKDNLRKMLKRSPDKVDALALTFAPYERAKVISLDL